MSESQILLIKISFLFQTRGVPSKSPTLTHSPTMYGDALNANLQVPIVLFILDSFSNYLRCFTYFSTYEKINILIYKNCAYLNID
jgi:hypothetical protein